MDRPAIYAALPWLKAALVIQDSPNALTFLVGDSTQPKATTKLSLFGTIDHGRCGWPHWTADCIALVVSLQDLLVTKLKVILQRIEAKDYRDIAALIDSGLSLAQGLAAAKALFDPAFQPSESLKAPVYFSGGDLQTLTTLEKQTLVTAASQVRDLPTVNLRSRDLV